ncbi:MAG: alpha/beta fold hydrolase [Anaerolineae bacterium]|nr:alpha/beta fold hydrolase [Anaerolineae bacterium]
MQKAKMLVTGWMIMAVFFSACGSAPMPVLPETAAPVTDAPPPVTEQPAVEPPIVIDLDSLEPQSVQFQSADGIPLAGTYLPPVRSPAPGVILMHMMGKDKESWGMFPALLQGVGMAHDGAQQPSYAVLAFDFRGHGESGGDAGDRSGMLEDAKAALAYFQSLPGVDTNRVVLIGASIGADAAVDVCSGGCIGAASLSPGSFLGLDYKDALLALGDKPVLCVAAEGDSHSAETCRGGEETGLSSYQVQIYQGSEHGTDMLSITEQEPFLTDLLFEWLEDHVLEG